MPDIPEALRLSAYQYDLPEHLIARHPPEARSGGRLLVCPPGAEPAADATMSPVFTDTLITDLPAWLAPGDLLVFNDTRVLKARLFAVKTTGGRVEVLVERIESDTRALVHLGASKPVRVGMELGIPGRPEHLYVEGKTDEGLFRMRLYPATTESPTGTGWYDLLEAIGELPLPPYFERPPEADDATRYQTVFADVPGAVAAPTAGLHFDPALLRAITDKGVQTATLTLHVGAGTFRPVRAEDVRGHVMHAERYAISPELASAITATRAAGGRVVAVGTTVVRALESAVDEATGQLRPGSGETRIFITPGYRFRVVDALFTNFHLPGSTLLMLVSAFAGRERVLAAYHHAVAREYRFFSYGDAMFLPALAPTPALAPASATDSARQ